MDSSSPEWFTLLQTLGIIASVLFTAHALRKAEQQRRIANYIELVRGHRDIWSMMIQNKGLQRVTEEDLDLEEYPVSVEERFFVTFIIFHLSVAFLMRTHNAAYPIEHLRKDVGIFLSLPIPSRVWKDIRPYQNHEIVSFVEDSLRFSGNATQS